MSILDLFKVDLDTPQPGGRQGESPRSAFTKYNDALDAIAQLVNITSVTEPSPTVPLMTWLDTSVTPPMIRRRNEANTDWVTIGPALTPFGTAATLDAIGTAPLYGRDSILGTVSESGGVPAGAIIERGSNANGDYVKFADGTFIAWGLQKLPVPSWTDGGGFFYSELGGFLFPASFAVGPRLILQEMDGQVSSRSSYVSHASFNATGVNSIFISSPRTAAPSTQPASFYFAAHGRWF